MDNWQEIKVNSKILGHISAGIYRSPASAIKELISNAFDADATRVSITTNWPNFDVITCYDNGNGMTQEKFKKIMTKEIGDSEKRVSTNGNVDDVTNLNRPIIGWLGIGMLGVAQICHEFQFISYHKATRTAFSASVRLADFLHEKVSNISPEEAMEQPIDVGQFMIEPIEYEPDKAGTYVVASEMRAAFVSKFRETSGKDQLPSKFSEFLKVIHRARSVKSLSDYWQMAWELSVACPLPYADANSFDWKEIDVGAEFKKQVIDLQQLLNRHQFEVVVDGLSLRKPNQYPLASPQTERKGQTKGKLFSINENLTVYGRPLKLFGYIYLQYGHAVEPMELRGLLVRIRNVAIGNYDPTLFAYPSVPTPRFNWLSGEIYVNAGLESALNIDRDSFNEMSPHFIKLTNFIHNLLKTEVFPEAARTQRRRTEGKNEDRQNKKLAILQSIIRQELGDNYTLISSEANRYPLTIDDNQDLLLVNNQSELLHGSKNKRELVQIIAHAFEISMLVPEEERREKFYQLLLEFTELDLL